MAGSQVNGAAGHFGRKMKKERLSRGWSPMEVAQRMGVDAAHLGRVGSGKRPPTENLAAQWGEAFTPRRGGPAASNGGARHWPAGPATVKCSRAQPDKA